MNDVNETARLEHGQALSGLYRLSEVARLCRVSESRLRSWARTGLITPSAEVEGVKWFAFRDLVAVRTARELTERGVSAQRIRTAVDALRESHPKVARSLAGVRLESEGRGLVVNDGEVRFDPLTGQQSLLFDEVETTAELIQFPTPAVDSEREAYELYMRACRVDEDDNRLDEAADLYRAALRINPRLACALTNLGNVYFRRDLLDEAQSLYRQALSIAPKQPEALYNLGFLEFERGDVRSAIDRFAAVIGLTPNFPDAHFSVAMAYEEVGQTLLAREHWREYLRLDPDGPWAAIAREHLGSSK